MVPSHRSAPNVMLNPVTMLNFQKSYENVNYIAIKQQHQLRSCKLDI